MVCFPSSWDGGILNSVKTVNFVKQIFCRFVGEKKGESILMNVSDIIPYIMKIMGFDFKKFVRVVSEMYKMR